MFFSTDVGVVLSFKVTEDGAAVDLTSAVSITLVVPKDGGALLLPCTIPSSAAGLPTYTTTGGEGWPKGTTACQLIVTFGPSRSYKTAFFNVFIE